MRKSNNWLRLGLERRNNRIPSGRLRQGDSVARQYAPVHVHRRIAQQGEVLLHQMGQERADTRDRDGEGGHHLLVQNSQKENTMREQT